MRYLFYALIINIFRSDAPLMWKILYVIIFSIVLLIILGAAYYIYDRYIKKILIFVFVRWSKRFRELLSYEEIRELDKVRKDFSYSHDEYEIIVCSSSALGKKIVIRDYGRFKKLYPDRDEKRILRDLLLDDLKKDPEYMNRNIEKVTNEAMNNINSLEQLLSYIESHERKRNPNYYESSIGQRIEAIIKVDLPNVPASRDKIIPSESPKKEDMPSNSIEWLNRGKNAEYYAFAIECFSKAIEIDPDCTEAYYQRGMAYKATVKWELMIEDFDKYINLNPADDDAYYQRGIANEHTEKWESAISDFERYLSNNRNNGDAFYRCGYCYMKMNNHQKAEDNFKIAISFGHERARIFSRST